jgi:hypothetical protein
MEKRELTLDKLYVMLHLYQEAREAAPDDAEIDRFEDDEVAIISILVRSVLGKMQQLAETVAGSPDVLHRWLEEEWSPTTGISAAKMVQLLFSDDGSTSRKE